MYLHTLIRLRVWLLLVLISNKSLNRIVDLLHAEDVEHRNERTIGDCLEYFMSNSMFESIGAYTKADRPHGFFKIGISVLVSIIETVHSTSLLSQANIHKTLVMVLDTILVSLTENSKYLNCEQEIVDFITSISLRCYNEPHITNLFFTNVKNMSTK